MHSGLMCGFHELHKNMVRANSNMFLGNHVVQLFQEHGYYKKDAQTNFPFWLHDNS